jgi:hypothetical protein
MQKRLYLVSKGAFTNNHTTIFYFRDDGHCPCLMFDLSVAPRVTDTLLLLGVIVVSEDTVGS